jgi:hypothetical protein
MLRRSALLAVGLALGCCAGEASAATPWWHLGIEQRPVGVLSGNAANEEQELVVSATGGGFTVVRPELGGETTPELPFNVSAAALQSALEALYGTGAVHVTGGVGDEAGDKPYILTFDGTLADQPVEAPTAESSTLKGGHSLQPLTHRLVEGRPDGQIAVLAENLGDASIAGATAPVDLSVALPAGLHAVGVSATVPQPGGGTERIPIPCSVVSLSCTFEGSLAPYDAVEMRVDVVNAGAAPGETVAASVSGGGASQVTDSRTVALAEGPPTFGAEALEMNPEEEGGSANVLAGAHPFQLTTTLTVNQGPDRGALASRGRPQVEPVALTKDVRVKLPPGLLGNPTAVPVCPMTQFLTFAEFGTEFVGDECPASTVVGVASVTVDEPKTIKGALTLPVPVFDVTPAVGEPARLGMYVSAAKVPVLLDTELERRPDGSYGVTVSSINAPQAAGLLNTTVTIWGDPADPVHDNARGWSCMARARGAKVASCQASEGSGGTPFLTLPTSCAGPLQALVELDPWSHPGGFSSLEPTPSLPATVGCGALRFEPGVKVTPSSAEASSPSGLGFDLIAHDEGLVSPGGRAESQVKKVVVTLPEEMTANPSLAAGLGACSEAEYESENIASTPGSGCPDSSKIGEVEVETPLLREHLTGAVYVARQNENPFHTLLALYVVVKDPKSGVLVRLAGKVEPNPATGQLVSTFDENPQVPFSHFTLRFRQGPRAPLVTPARCGTYTTRVQLSPWASPTSALERASSFTVSSGAGGAPCPAPGDLRLAPTMAAGTESSAAGQYSPFDLRLDRGDGEQEITGVGTTLPPGLTANLTGVPFCQPAGAARAEAKTGAQEQAAPSCPPATEIGQATVGAGVGSTLAYAPGRLYMSGPLEGAPFSMIVISRAVVGPFDLGNVVVRLPIKIDPNTTQVTVGPGTPDQIPHILDGIVVHVRDIRVDVNRPNFILNATNCTPQTIAATVTGAGTNFQTAADDPAATVQNRYQASGCAALAFQPKFQATVSSKVSRLNGTSFKIKLTLPAHDTNVAKVKVELPKALPARLPTLHEACREAQFTANPAGCPSASVVGHAKALTPLLPVPLEGPAYFVSHGGAQFPDLVMVLQGYGITIHLTGATFVNGKTGITSSTFKTVPDQPVSSFELSLPAQRFSALSGYGNLCKAKLKMPTIFNAQNGAEIRRTTTIAVTGCKKKAKKHAKKRSAKRRRGKHG